MRTFFETLAFTLVIGGQFLGAIYLISRRSHVYVDAVQKSEAAKPAEDELARASPNHKPAWVADARRVELARTAI